MNSIYRVVFNAVTGAWQAVSEIARGRSKSSRRAQRVRGAAAGPLLLVAALSSLGSASALACTPYPPVNNDTVTCSSTYWLGFASSSSNLTITVNATSSLIQNSGGGGAAMLANGGHLLLTVSGTIDPSGLVAMPVLTSGVIAGNGSASSIIIQSDNNGIIRGTARSPSAFLTTFSGMAIEVWNTAGGQTRINNAGLIASRDIAGLSTPTVAADNAVMAIRGGGQVVMSNVASGRIIGRIAFERSSGVGHTFLNAGSIRGSVSMGAGGVNEFTAVTLGSLTGDGSTTGSLGNSLGYNLTFAPSGQVDGGAGGVNTLKLRNPGSTGNTGAVTIYENQYVNFNYLEVNGGTWTIHGPLLDSASSSTMLVSGTAIVDNSLVFGNGIVTANGGTLQSANANVNLANAISLSNTGLTVSGDDDLTLSGVISGVRGTLRKSGSGGLTLTRINSYNGMTYLDAGTLILGNDNALGNSTLVVGGGTLAASTAVTVTNDISVSAPAMTVGVGGSNDITLTGQVDPGAKLVKQGTSNLTLGSNTVFSGGANLQGGTLTVGSGSAVGSSSLIVSGDSNLASLQSITLNNAVSLNRNLTVTGSNDLQLDGLVSGSGKLIKAGAGKLTLNAANTHTGGVELQGGTLRLDNASGLGTGGLRVSGDSTLEVNTPLIYNDTVAVDANLELAQGSNTVLSGALSGSGTITKTGVNTLRLDKADNTFNGSYDIQQGFLTNNAVNALGASPNVNLASGTVLNVSAPASVGQLTGSGSAVISAIANLTLGGNNQSSTFSGTFSGGGSLIKAGTGTLKLTNTNTSSHSGSTQVNGGTLDLSGRLTNSTVTVNSGGTLRSTGQLDGGVIVRGGGTLALDGGTAGAVQVQSGGKLVANAGSGLKTGELFVSGGGMLTFGLGHISTTPIIDVLGNLTLDNTTLNFTDAGGVSNGVHRLMNYSGTLTVTSLNLGSMPAGVASNQAVLMYGLGRINLLVSSPSLAMQFWDGGNTTASNTVEGGSGTWNGSLGNWTDAMGSNNWAWASQGAVFQGDTAGTVTVDGTQWVSFLQFRTDGYRLVSGTNGSLSLTPGRTNSTEIRVDPGVTATLNLPLAGSSRLDKVGNGTLALTGDNTYTGGTQLAAGTLLVGHTNALGTGLVQVLGGATLGTTSALSLGNHFDFSGSSTLDVSHDLKLTGTLSGSGSITKTGAGTLTLAGANTSTGETIISHGGLVASVANLASGAITNNAALELNQASDATLTQAISGSGSFTKTGAGTLTLAGANTSTGATTISDGGLVASVANLASGAIINNAALELKQASNAALAQAIGGSGTVSKTGIGALTLAGANTYSGGTTIHDGSLVAANASALGSGNVTVGTGAALEVTSGTTLAVGGNLDFQQGSTYRIQADSAALTRSKINVGGTATLAGSVLHVGPERNASTDFQVGQTYTILHASQINGTFSAATSNYAYLDAALDYLQTSGTTTDVTLKLQRKSSGGGSGTGTGTGTGTGNGNGQMAFAELAETRNQRAVANGIESLSSSHPLSQYIENLPSGAPAAAFNILSGDIHANVQGSLVRLGNHAPSLSSNHLHSNLTAGMNPGAAVAQSDGPLPASAWPSSKALPAWTELVGHWQTYHGDGNAASLKQRTAGIFVGMDEEVGSSGWRLGASLGYTNADGEVADRSSTSKVDSYSGTVYGGKSFGTGTGPRINVLGGLAYTWHDIETTRNLTSLGQTLKANYSANTAQLFAEVGYAIGQYDKLGVEPFVGVSLGQQRTGSFQEKGGFAALSSQSSTDDLASTTLGVRVHNDFQVAGKDARVRATMGWRHAFGDVATRKTMAFEGGQNFTVAGAPLARNTAVLGLEGELPLSRTAALVVGYRGEVGSGQRDHAANVKLRWAF